MILPTTRILRLYESGNQIPDAYLPRLSLLSCRTRIPPIVVAKSFVVNLLSKAH